MKDLRKYILSALLFAFTFFVVHDYYIGDSSQYTLEKVFSQSGGAEQLEDIHDNIHAMFEVNLEETVFLLCTCFIKKELLHSSAFLSYLIFSLDKPPVI